jgi:hypothetical protein
MLRALCLELPCADHIPLHHTSKHRRYPTATMGDTVPAKLKSLQLAPFAKRAAQLEKFKPIVTYWSMYQEPHGPHVY